MIEKIKYIFSPIALILILTAAVKIYFLVLIRHHVYTPGEDEIIYIENSLRMIFSRFQPDIYFHGALYFDLMAIIHYLIYAGGVIAGRFQSASDFLLLYLNTPELMYMIPRAASVLISTATLVILYQLGKRLWNAQAALFAVFFYAFLPVVMVQSTKASLYSLASLLILACTYCTVRYLQEGHPRQATAAGALFGLALGTDFYALFLIPFLIAVVIKRGREKDITNDICRFVVTAIILFFLANPYFILRSEEVTLSLTRQFSSSLAGGEYIKPAPQPLFYLRMLSGQPYIYVVMFAAAGIYFSIKDNRPEIAALQTFPVLNILLFSFTLIQLDHYIIHALPFICLIAGYGAARISRCKVPVGLLPVGITLLMAIVGIGAFPIRYEPYPNSAWEARDWFIRNTPKGSTVLIHPRTIPFGRSRLFKILYHPDKADNQQLFFETVAKYLKAHPQEDYALWGGYLTQRSVPFISEHEFEYIVLSEQDYDEFTTAWVETNTRPVKQYVPLEDNWRIRIHKVIDPGERPVPHQNIWWQKDFF